MRQPFPAAALLASLLLVTACGMEPFDPPVAGEPPPGPGLFTGPDGKFVLYGPADRPRRKQPTGASGRQEEEAGPAVAK